MPRVAGSVRSPPMRLARVLGAIGRVCITAGVLILLFVAYQLWGTGIREAQAQNRLETSSRSARRGRPPRRRRGHHHDGARRTTEPGARRRPPPADGDAVAQLRIPAIGVDKIVVEGVEVADLKKGPGHYPDSPLPGQPGNAAIAGHRTTYGAPFNRLDELEQGDEILVTTVQGSFRYEVREQLIVNPDQVEVLDDFGDDRLTLTACHPKYSARQRIVVVAALIGAAAPASAAPAVRPERRPVTPRSADARQTHRRRARRRAGLGLAGRPAGAGLRPHLDRGLAAGQALAQVARLPGLPARVPGRAVLLLRELLPAAAGELLSTCGGERRRPPGGPSITRRRSAPAAPGRHPSRSEGPR